MRKQIRLLLGISIFWLALSALSDGVNALVLPLQISGLSSKQNQATILGVLTFLGLLTGALIQPIAGAFSDRLYPLLGRKGFIGIGLGLILVSLFLFATFPGIAGVVVGYFAIQISISIAQAGQQGLIPDLIADRHRGLASGLKGFMDLAGAMLGFVLLGQLLGSGRSFIAILAIGGLLIMTYAVAAWLTPEDRANPETVVKKTAIPLNEIFRLDLAKHATFVQLVISRFLFLLGIYGTGRFLLLFVANRLGLTEDQAAEQAGYLLAGLALVTLLASPLTGWLADRIGRVPLMITGSILSAMSALMLILASNMSQIFLFGGLMSLGSAAFAGGSWALLADLAPKDEAARFFGLANFSTAGSAAMAGLMGPVIDVVDRVSPGAGFSVLFGIASLAFLASIWPLKTTSFKEFGVKYGNKRKVRTDDSRLAVVSLPADSAASEEDQNP